PAPLRRGHWGLGRTGSVSLRHSLSSAEPACSRCKVAEFAGFLAGLRSRIHMRARRRLLRLAASREHKHGSTMKKTTFRQKLVLRTQTITVLSNEHHQVVAA